LRCALKWELGNRTRIWISQMHKMHVVWRDLVDTSCKWYMYSLFQYLLGHSKPQFIVQALWWSSRIMD
jgi:hypothetical protein